MSVDRAEKQTFVYQHEQMIQSNEKSESLSDLPTPFFLYSRVRGQYRAGKVRRLSDRSGGEEAVQRIRRELGSISDQDAYGNGRISISGEVHGYSVSRHPH